MMTHYKMSDVAVEVNDRENNPASSKYDRFVGLEHYVSGEVIIRNYGSTENLESTMKIFQNGDVLVARRNVYLKRASMVDFDGLTSGDSIVLRAKNPVIGRILPFVLNTDAFWDFADQYSDGTMSKRLSPKTLMTYEFDLPDEDELEKFADLLWAANDTRESYQALLRQTDELVKSQFIELFGDVKTNDKSWKTKPLKELCNITRGGSPRPIANYLGGTIPWIKIGDATDGDDIYINSTKEYIIEEGMRKSRYVKAGSLIFANCGVSLGFCRIINIDGCIHDGWLALQDIDKSLNKEFLLMTINQLTDYFRSIAPGATQPNLNTEIMGNYQQILPPLELQEKYIAFVKQTDKSKFEIKKAIENTSALIKSLMQQDLTN
jgi:restriction endonuclease S subunit